MKRKTNKQNGNKPVNDADLRPTVRLLVLLAFMKLAVIIGLSVVVNQLSDTIKHQQTTIDRTDAAVQRVTNDEATRAQQVVLYKIFLAQCEGRQINGTLERTGDKTVKECADRLFLLSPQLPGNQQILPDDADATQ